jgi:hypothetical protein
VSAEPARDALLESLTETRLYSIGAYFCDRHPELVEDVIGQSEAIEREGLERYAERESMELENCFQTLMTGLAVRYFKAVAGQQPA